MNQLISQFKIKGHPRECGRYGHGHINETYLVACDSGLSYILQKINKKVFTNPEQNPIRARTHFKMVADMEEKWEIMKKIVKECLK